MSSAERTPNTIRERIDTELGWRDYETTQLDASRDAQRLLDARVPFNDDIP
jgi:hypothetical protein